MDRRTVIRWLGFGLASVVTGEAAWLLARDTAEGPREAASPPQPATPGAASSGPTEGATSRAAPAADARMAQRTASASPSVAASTAVPVVCREAWGARTPRSALGEHRIERLTVHHTAVALDDRTSGPSRVRAHQRHHLEQGLADLAYHHLIDRTGTVYVGRPTTAPGETFTDYDPAGHYLPCLEGDFDRHDPSAEQLDALITLLAWAVRTFDVSPDTIAGHHDHAATACPGRALRLLLDGGVIRREVERRLGAEVGGLLDLCGPRGRAHIEAVEAGRV